MALATNHVDRYLPWLLEVVEAYAPLDEVGWSLTPTMVPIDQGARLCWFMVLSVPNPLLGQGPVAAPTYSDWHQSEFEFKEWVLQGLHSLRETRERLLTAPPKGPNGHPIIGG